MPNTHDLVIVGGGIYGASILRDAALRGISAVLVERGEFGCGTSHNSNKIVHSGIRYLQHFDLPRVIECIRETRNWLRIAPHLVRPLPFVVPSYERGLYSKEVLGLGVKIHDLFKRGAGCGMPGGGILSRPELQSWFPMLPEAGLRGAAYWYDGQILNANQLIYQCIADAESRGARALNYTEARELIIEGGAVRGVVVASGNGTGERELRSRAVVNASGPWLSHLLPAAMRERHRYDRHYLGMNLVVDQVSDRAGLAMFGPGQEAERKKRRLYFLTPWKGYSLIGTSHVFRQGQPDDIQLTEGEIAEFVNGANQAFPFLSLRPDRVRYVYWGLTPAAGDQESLTRSRQFSIIDHARTDKLPGVVSVMGVKLTSARYIAERVVDLVEKQLGRKRTRCLTAEVALPGAPMATECDTDGLADALRSQRDVVDLERLVDFVTCRTELGQFGAVDGNGLSACADAMAEIKGWNSERRDAEYEAAKARLRI